MTERFFRAWVAIASSDNATFTAKLAREGAEFLASSDSWFRPVFVTDGPDGALYVCDMYRKVVDHRRFFAKGVYKPEDFVEVVIYRARALRTSAGGLATLPERSG